MANLMEFSGSELLLSGIRLESCSCPGLRITSLEAANVTIEDSLFANFSRTLASGRVDVSSPGTPAPISASTAALAVHAGAFAGSLTIRNTGFLDNMFSSSPADRRLLERAALADELEAGTPGDTQVAFPSEGSLGQLNRLQQYRRRIQSAIFKQDPLVNNDILGASWGRAAGSALGMQRRQLTADTPVYSLPLLENAKAIHPGLEAGPWADDMEAVVAIICGGLGEAACNIKFDGVTISNNTGVATGGLYVLCDGALSCEVDLINCTVADNKLLWQAASEENSLPEGEAIVDYEDYSVPGPGVSLLQLMAPWLTYTYPLLEFYMTKAELGANDFGSSMLVNASQYPRVTGRTLGAVVLHQRNSPTPGVRTSGQAMMRVRVVGGLFYGNDGSAIISTATDFMEMAGGNGTWSGGPPRHSADVDVTDVTIRDHTSGWPAIWLRWPRNVNVQACQVTRSTGAVWLDEVRDSAKVEDSSFIGNSLSQRWLDYAGFMSSAALENIAFGSNVGAGVSHVVKVQMTALGEVPNEASVVNCRFEDNPSYITGVLYARASDSHFVEKDSQPGSTLIEVVGTNFTSNICRRWPNTCTSAERSLYVMYVQNANIRKCRFENNANGGMYLDTVYGGAVYDSIFTGNTITYNGPESADTDNAYGGAGVLGNVIGNGGINITGTEFVNNSAYVGGGAVYLRLFGYTSINNNRFDGNTAETYDGGALWMEYSSVSGNTVPMVNVVNNTFTNNVAGRNGGGICANSITSNVPWIVYGCRFVNNTALRSPAPNRGANIQDRAGGGAFFATSNTDIDFRASMFTDNKVLGYAGGAIRVVDSSRTLITNCGFYGNVAIMGGAVAATRLSTSSVWKNCTFTDNTVVDPWAWPDTSSVAGWQNRAIPSLSFIDPGYGGAVYTSSAGIILQNLGKYVNNSAKFGGAVAMISSQAFSLFLPDPDTTPYYNTTVAPEVADAVGLSSAGAQPTLPYRFLFANNSAMIGGAMYMSDVDVVQTQMDLPFGNHPGIVFTDNLANGGAGIYLKGNGKVNMQNCRFAANNASMPPLMGNYSGLYGRERDYATAMAHPCYNGGGGGICAVGQAGQTIQITSSDMIANTAKDGAGLYVAEGLDCIRQAGCYNVALNSVNMTGNKAASRGGGIFWTHEGVLSINSCPTDQSRTYLTNGTVLGVANASMTGELYNVTYTFPGRKGPAKWYGQLTSGNQHGLLSAWGGPTSTSSSGLYTRNGQLVSVPQAVFALETTTSSDPLVVTSGSTISDTVFRGIPSKYLPCSNWDNSAGTGNDISTTPYYLLAPPRIDFYTSNTDVKLQVTVHDWLGQNCTGDSSTQPLVIVTVDSREVSGSLTMQAVDGSANFTSMRLRAREGLHNVSMTGRLYTPSRELFADEVQIYVRPCAINEFLSPKNLDECIPCDIGTYNFNVSAVSCAKCPDNTACSYPDTSVCKTGDSCDPVGFLVPDDGYWHINFFSNQVLECPNPNSCMSENRSLTLARIQQQIWQAARTIQLNTSNAVADQAARQYLADLVDSRQDLRRLLQQKAISDEDDAIQVLLMTVELLPEYQQSQCANGYTGTLCGECAEGYGWRKIATCVKCPPRVLNNLYYLLVTILTLTMLVITVYSSLREQKKPGKLVGGPDTARKNKPSSTSAPAPASFPTSVPAGPPTGTMRLASSSMPPTEAVAMVLLPNSSSMAHRGAANKSFSNSLYEDPAVAAARGNFGSAPGTNQGPQQQQPIHDASVRSQPGAATSSGSPGTANISASGAVAESTEHTNMVFDVSGPLGESVDYNNALFDDGPERNIPGVTPEIQPTDGAPPAATATGSVTHPSVQNPLVLHSVPMMEDTPPHTPRMHMPTSPVGVSLAPPPMAETRPPPRAQSIRFPDTNPRQFAQPSTIVKILVSYVQVLALLQNVPLDIPGVVDIYYRINNQAISYPGMLVSLDCSLPSDYHVSKAIVRVTLTALAPLYIFAGAIIFFLLYNVIDYYYLIDLRARKATRKKKKIKGPLRAPTLKLHMEDYLGRQLIVTFITIFFFFYPSVVQSLMTIFNCNDVNTSAVPDTPLAAGLGLQTDSVWSQDFGLVCYKGPHLGLSMGLGVPGVLLIAIGWPIVSGLLVTQRLPCITNILLTEEMTDFFLADFKPQYVWWESLVMLRKLAIAVIVTLVEANTSAGVQLLLVFIILVIAMAAHLYAQPYHHSYTNLLESMSLVVLLFTLYFSLFFSFSSAISSGGRVTISIIILVLNIIMVLTLVNYVLKAYWSVAMDTTGLAKLDAATRRRLTTAQIQQAILENMAAAQGSITARQRDHRPSYGSKMAGLYAGVFWASMRLNSTTSKVMTRVRTLVAQPPSDSDMLDSENPPNLERNSAPGRLSSVTAARALMPSSAGQSRTSSFATRSNNPTSPGAEPSAAAVAAAAVGFGFAGGSSARFAGGSTSARDSPLSVSRTPSQASNPRLPPYPVALDPESSRQPNNKVPPLTTCASAGPRLATQAPPRSQSRLSTVATARPTRTVELTPPPAEDE